MAEILYVEDQERIAEILQRRLERQGHRVELAHDATEAIRKARENRPQLVILDIDLGENSADGWEVNRLLKDNESTASIPVIALTASDLGADDRSRARREGFAHYLAKPIDFAQIERVIATAVATRGDQ